jgi:very-short-patch-repair endonuclease
MTEGHTRPRIDSFRRATAKRLRANATEPEQILWRALRRIPTLGTHFRRQVPIGRYVADIACLAKRVVIEVDGSQHGKTGNIEHDAKRTAWLESQGYRVLRFWNPEVTGNIDGVVDTTIHGSASPKWTKHDRSREGSAGADFTPPRRAAHGDPPPPGEGKRSREV